MIDFALPAIFSPCRTWRYTLAREIAFDLYGNACRGPLVICGYNPSTADEAKDDPTIRREIGFARDWGCNRLVKVNAFGGRGADPAQLDPMDDPIGPLNDIAIDAAIHYAQRNDGILLAAWGAPKGLRKTKTLALRRLGNLRKRAPWQILGLTMDGYPRHPLYMPKTARPMAWDAAA